MKVSEIKSELEKVSKLLPDLREDLNKAYHMSGSEKKRQIKLLWKEYADRYKEVMSSKASKNLQ